VSTGKDNILIDAGLGQTRAEKFRDIYDARCGRLTESLSRLGVAPEEITVVIFTHLHFDHAGGATRAAGGGALEPVFPNARHVVQKMEWEDAHDSNELTAGSYIVEELDSLAQNVRLDLVDGDVEVAPGIRAIVTGGHTRGHHLVLIESRSRTCIFPGDLVPMAGHVNLPYIMSYDLYPLETLSRKRKWLARTAREGWLCCFEHDPRLTFAHLHAAGPERLEVRPVEEDV
jgi:glyoxylase-like metal-dependent hydrolase (beta-lactamase superfamily II)